MAIAIRRIDRYYPKGPHEKRVLFIEDPLAKYEDKQVDNFRLNISGNALVDDFIALFRARFRLLNKGERGDVVGEICLIGKEADFYEGIEMMIIAIQNMLLNGCSRNSQCFCGSEVKYKKCHGKVLPLVLQKI